MQAECTKPGASLKLSSNNVAKQIQFAELTNLLEELSKIIGTGSIEKKKNKLRNFFKKWQSTAKENMTSDQGLIDYEFFQLLRLILPREDKRYYNLKEAKLAELLIDVITISRTSDDGKRLLNYKEHNSMNMDGDFAGDCFCK